MNEKPKNNYIEKKNEIIKKKTLNSNIVNKKINNKDSIRKQKRIFQMQKRHALFNEEDFQELESENNINIKLKEEPNELNSFNLSKKLEHINTTKKDNYTKNNLSFNCNNSLKDNLNIDQIQHKKTYVIQNSKNNSENIIPEKIEPEMEQQNLKEEEISLKKKNTNSNTNDEDKTSTEALFPNESEINRKKSKSNLHNDSLGKDIFNKIINGDIDENPNIFSGSNDNNEIEDEKIEKEEVEFQDNIINNFNFNNIVNDETGSKDDENIENENSVIINETDHENNINENNEVDNKDDSNVELNISNLEIDINEINEEENTQNEDDLTMLGPNSNEFAKKYLSSKSKSFIQFNNNLTARVTADSLKNSLSYMLALCPELMGGVDKKNLIKENYAATDVISEDIEAENFTPRQSEKIDESPPKKIKEEKNKNNNSINTNDYLSNKIFRNKDTIGPFEISKKEKGNISPKTHYKNRSKIDRNTFNNIHDLDNDIKNNNFIKSKKTFINTNYKLNNSNKNEEHNFLYTNYNTNNDKYRNSTIKNTEHVTIKYRHQKAKSLVNNNSNNQIDSFNLNSNIIYKQHSPKQASGIFNKKNTMNKIIYKNVDNRKKKPNSAKDKESEQCYNKQNYLSNDSNKKSDKKFFKKSNSNAYSNTMVKNHNYCKSDLKDKVGDIKKKLTFVRKNNAPDFSKSNNLIHNKKYAYNEISNKICFTEKSNKSKNYTSFISHLKKNTPEKVNNVSEQNINHSKKLSMQISDGHKFFMNSINTNNHTNTRYNNDIKKNIKKKRIGSNNFTIKSTPLSNYFSFNKNKVNNNSSNITFIKKTTTIKEDKHSPIKPNHNKSKTSFIMPSYQNLNQTKNRLLKKKFTLINSNNKSKKTSEISSKNIKRNYIKKINNKFNEIKKVVNDSSVKIVHKKINTIGQPNELTKLLNNNSNIGTNKQLKDSSSYSNYKKNFNKHKIILALQHIKFSPMTNYSKVLNELYKSKKNLFVILVYTDSIKKYIFRGLYEINSSDQKTANKIFAPGYGQNKINVARLNNFFNYQSNNGEFIRIKFNNENDKKFNADTIIAY